MIQRIRSWQERAREEGASAVEYGLMVAAVAALIVGVVFGLGGFVKDTFNKTCGSIASQGTGTTPDCPAPTAPPAGG